MSRLVKMTAGSNQDLFSIPNMTKVGYVSVGETFADLKRDWYQSSSGASYPIYGSYTTVGWGDVVLQPFAVNNITLEGAYSSKFAKKVISPSQLIFETRRQVRVYSGTTLIETLTTGSEIRTDGTSTSGATYPDRLYITGYRRAGATQWKYFSSNTWAETGIRAGYYTWPSIKN